MGKTFRGNIKEAEDNDVRINLLFEGLDFKTAKSTGGKQIVQDVSVNKISKGFSITFRNGLVKAINSPISIAVKGNSIFFKKDPRGWTISHSGKSNGYVQLRQDAFDLTDFIGDYEVKYFEPLDIWYIQK